MPQPTVLAVEATRLDYATADDFRERLIAAVGDGDAAVIVNLERVEAISSLGLRALVAAKHRVRDGGAIVIAAPQPLVREILGISRFDALFPLFDSVADARAALNGS